MGSPQLDHFAAARRLGIRTVLPVGSWDHLSSKALLRTYPDRLTVWNESQRKEAVDLHGVPDNRVVVTGAQCYDQWFGRAPSEPYATFCEKVGLRPDQPFILYVVSSLFKGTVSEPDFVLAWIQAVRRSDDPRLKDIGILVRPHPARLDEWRGIDLTGYRNVAFWGAHPVDAQAKADYFDSLYYSAAVVGINTSAFIEGAVVGKPVLTVLLPGSRPPTRRTLHHFHYLLNVNGGLLRVSRSLDERAAAGRGVDRPGGGDEKAERFVAEVRPPVRPRRRRDAALRGRHRIGRDAAGAGAGARSPPGSPSAACPTPPRSRSACAAIRGASAAQPAAEGCERRKLAVLRAVKQIVANQFIASGSGGARWRPPIVESSLTPKAGRQRDPAKTLAGTEFREARETRELLTVLGRSGRPIILGPWLSETGFELLYWIPFLAWASAATAATRAPDRRRAAARRVCTLTSRRTTRTSSRSHARRVPPPQRAADHRAGRAPEASRSASFDRDLPRVQEKRGLSGAEVLHPSQMPALRQLLAAADAGDADRAFSRFAGAAGAAHRRAPSCPSGTSPRSSTATWRCRPPTRTARSSSST